MRTHVPVATCPSQPAHRALAVRSPPGAGCWKRTTRCSRTSAHEGGCEVCPRPARSPLRRRQRTALRRAQRRVQGAARRRSRALHQRQDVCGQDRGDHLAAPGQRSGGAPRAVRRPAAARMRGPRALPRRRCARKAAARSWQLPRQRARTSSWCRHSRASATWTRCCRRVSELGRAPLCAPAPAEPACLNRRRGTRARTHAVGTSSMPDRPGPMQRF